MDSFGANFVFLQQWSKHGRICHEWFRLTRAQNEDNQILVNTMKLAVVILLAATTVYGQKNIPEYVASNGVTYQVGDTVKLGHGSGPMHEFLYVLTSGGASLTRGYSGGTVVIKKIHRVNFRGLDKVYFETSLGKYLLYIEDAIAYCEVPCK